MTAEMHPRSIAPVLWPAYFTSLLSQCLYYYYCYYYYCYHYYWYYYYYYLNAVLLKVSEVSDHEFCFVINDGSLVFMHVAAGISKPWVGYVVWKCVVIKQKRIHVGILGQLQDVLSGSRLMLSTTTSQCRTPLSRHTSFLHHPPRWTDKQSNNKWHKVNHHHIYRARQKNSLSLELYQIFSPNLQRLQMRIQATYPANCIKITRVVQ